MIVTPGMRFFSLACRRVWHRTGMPRLPRKTRCQSVQRSPSGSGDVRVGEQAETSMGATPRSLARESGQVRGSQRPYNRRGGDQPSSNLANPVTTACTPAIAWRGQDKGAMDEHAVLSERAAALFSGHGGTGSHTARRRTRRSRPGSRAGCGGCPGSRDRKRFEDHRRETGSPADVQLCAILGGDSSSTQMQKRMAATNREGWCRAIPGASEQARSKHRRLKGQANMPGAPGHGGEGPRALSWLARPAWRGRGWLRVRLRS